VYDVDGMHQQSFQPSDRTASQIADLARWWGEAHIRHNTAVIARCVELIWQKETKKNPDREGDPGRGERT